jgi:hypothetical protein
MLANQRNYKILPMKMGGIEVNGLKQGMVSSNLYQTQLHWSYVHGKSLKQQIKYSTYNTA